jgi:hypothetical protein
MMVCASSEQEAELSYRHAWATMSKSPQSPYDATIERLGAGIIFNLKAARFPDRCCGQAQVIGQAPDPAHLVGTGKAFQWTPGLLGCLNATESA